MTLNSVVLPQPDGPITAKNSPGETLSETWSTAVSTPSGVSNRMTMSSTTRMGSTDFTLGIPRALWSESVVATDIQRARSLLALAHHHRRHCRGVARLDTHIDDSDMPGIDRGDHLPDGRDAVARRALPT